MNTICERVRSARKLCKMPQYVAAKKLGYCTGALSRMEHGTLYIKADTLRRMCLLYNVSADWILGIRSNE